MIFRSLVNLLVTHFRDYRIQKREKCKTYQGVLKYSLKEWARDHISGNFMKWRYDEYSHYLLPERVMTRYCFTDLINQYNLTIWWWKFRLCLNLKWWKICITRGKVTQRAHENTRGLQKRSKEEHAMRLFAGSCLLYHLIFRQNRIPVIHRVGKNMVNFLGFRIRSDSFPTWRENRS